MCQGVNGEMFSRWGRGDPRGPTEGEVDGGEAYRQVPGQVLDSEGGEGRKDCGSLAEGGLVYGGVHATLRAARRLLYL